MRSSMEQPIQSSTPRSTASSAAEGRLKVDAGMKAKKKQYLKSKCK